MAIYSPLAPSAPPAPLARQIAASLDWWRDAGVDMAFADDVQCWLGDPPQDNGAQSAPEAAPLARKQPAAAKSEPATPAVGGDKAQWPADLDRFRQWWLEEPSLNLGGTGPRIAPRGVANAPLMVLVPMPEAADSDVLLSGMQGQFISRMLRAMDIAEDDAYIAAVLPAHMPQPDWQALDSAGLGRIALHHIALARPQRLLVLGQGILPLLGHDPAQATAQPCETAIQAAEPLSDAHAIASVPTLAAISPERLLESPQMRKRLWHRWLNWTGNTA